MVVVNLKLREQLASRIPSLYSCFQCGTCTALCPVSQLGYSPRKILKKSQLGVVDEDSMKSSWMCTTCSLCEIGCPRDVDIVDVIREIRSAAYRQKIAPPKFSEILWSMYENGNPWRYTSVDRKRAMAQIRPPADKEIDVLIFPCCMAIGDGKLLSTLKMFVDILKRAGLKVGIFSALKCCGDIIQQIGDRDFLEEYAKSLNEELSKYATVVVTLSPHCAYALKKNTKLKIKHYIELLIELIDKNKLNFKNIDEVVTYHDPCYLARYLNIVEEPRKVIESIPGVKLVEMEYSRERSMCCGAGGGGIFLEHSNEVAKARFKQAMDTEARTLTTACPYCIRMLSDAGRQLKSRVYVGDIIELINRALT